MQFQGLRSFSSSHRAVRGRKLTVSVVMVEGHGCHRVGHAHRQLLLGHTFKCSSPNGRFVEGAKAIDGKFLVRIEVIGKNLFYFFGPSKDAGGATDVVHFHFGMSGAFRVVSLPGPEPKPTTRLQLLNEELGLVGHLSAMTLDHGPSPSFYHEKAAKLGPDPLREDADKEVLWNQIQTSKKPIGLVLMSQDMVAGIGNIYRAEILFKAGVHPEQPAASVDRDSFDRIWFHSVTLLQRGFVTGSILTVDPEDAAVLGQPWTRRYIYNHSNCGFCGGPVRVWDMAARKVYCCPKCQPLRSPEDKSIPSVSAPKSPAPGLSYGITAARKAAMAASRPAQPFISHCAPEDSAVLSPARMTVPQLKASLKAVGLPASGSKGELLQRLQQIKPDAGNDKKEEEDEDTPDLGDEIDLAEKLLKEKFVPSSFNWGEGSEVGSVVAAGLPLPVTHVSSGHGTPAATNTHAKVEQLSPSSTVPNASWTVTQLRAALIERGLVATGRKDTLLQRLLQHSQHATSSSQHEELLVPLVAGTKEGEVMLVTTPITDKSVGGAGVRRKRRGPVTPGSTVDVKPGTADLLDEFVSAREAALEKERAGEGRNVEHVALYDDETEALTAKSNKNPRRRK
ncbi:hypothetical protein CEUSTIGMA_g12005.t1 [Chlamydomonas eustigma]|uniref:DNA-(apurinic or apyrimidinic site) lyase n=1 Tax=Chlamydomonas eustigma TaxID=1157962 RepID=A0A250XNC2_9CHLO|nr:hypothetical protein CEUSTIGMA_g12005.t1 [Chlamydomonas eustigma]|eukprot:GAX84584.1 hypothetical protein CEUSTIGMA_g12005.t1 [Chlamydomonas eustigma]